MHLAWSLGVYIFSTSITVFIEYRERSDRQHARISVSLVCALSSGIRAKVVHGTLLIKMSTSVNKGDEVAADYEEIVRPVYADDIP